MMNAVRKSSNDIQVTEFRRPEVDEVLAALDQLGAESRRFKIMTECEDRAWFEQLADFMKAYDRCTAACKKLVEASR
jgi:hypothetical protein